MVAYPRNPLNTNVKLSGGQRRTYFNLSEMEQARLLLDPDTYKPLYKHSVDTASKKIREKMKKATPYYKHSKNPSAAKDGWVETKQSTYHNIVKNSKKPLLGFIYGIPKHVIKIGEEGVLSNYNTGMKNGWPNFYSKANVNHPGVKRTEGLHQAWVNAIPDARDEILSTFVDQFGKLRHRNTKGQFTREY